MKLIQYNHQIKTRNKMKVVMKKTVTKITTNHRVINQLSKRTKEV